MIEEWKRITLKRNGLLWTYPYEISNIGRVRNIHEKILKPFKRHHRGGDYYCVDLYLYGKKKRMTIHRLVALHFLPNPKFKEEINHLDLDNFNNKVNNLEWCTRSENEKHRRFMNAHKDL
jgi:hypothetical protein